MSYARNGILVRLTYLLVSFVIWFLSIGGYLFRSRKVVLCYHGIDDFSADAFRKQMRTISYRSLSLGAESTDNFKRFIRPAVVVTFDDAFENLLCNALPVINELNIPVSIYVVTGCLGSAPKWLLNSKHNDEYEQLMSEEQIKSLADNPLITLGVHTHTHPKLTSLESESVRDELSESKRYLEKLIGRTVVSLAFPHGDFNENVLHIAESSGLTQFLTLEEQMISAKQTEGKIGRFSMDPSVWPIEFRLTVDGAYSWLFYFRKIIRLVRRSVGK